MLYAVMKTLLQRRLQDTAAVQFDATAIVDPLLAFGISKLQGYIQDINPSAFVDRATFPTVAGTDLYAKTASSLRVIRAEISKTSGGYLKLPVRNFYEVVEEWDGSFSDGNISISDLGNKWLMAPTPDAVKTVRVWYVPVLTDGTAWDAVATYIPPSLHLLPVDFALVEALAETAEATVEARVRISEGLALISALFGRSPEQVQALSMAPFSSAQG